LKMGAAVSMMNRRVCSDLADGAGFMGIMNIPIGIFSQAPFP
jgi:hypothetical protein